MFIPIKSGGQIFVNLRKNKEKKKIFKKKFSGPPRLLFAFRGFILVFNFCLFFFRWDSYVPFYSFLVRLSPETNYFVPVSILFILIEYSLYVCNFSEFFKNPVFRFHSIHVA